MPTKDEIQDIHAAYNPKIRGRKGVRNTKFSRLVFSSIPACPHLGHVLVLGGHPSFLRCSCKVRLADEPRLQRRYGRQLCLAARSRHRPDDGVPVLRSQREALLLLPLE